MSPPAAVLTAGGPILSGDTDLADAVFGDDSIWPSGPADFAALAEEAADQLAPDRLELEPALAAARARVRVCAVVSGPSCACRILPAVRAASGVLRRASPILGLA